MKKIWLRCLQRLRDSNHIRHCLQINHGYAIYESIIGDLPHVMEKGSPVVFEIGYNQGEALKSIILNKFPDKKIDIIKDINGHDRIVSFKW